VQDSGIHIEPLRVTQRDESVTRYKGFYITAWSGTYLLEGKRKYLDFLYQTGLGSKTSQGFGMFDVEAYT
jgi:CRISPR-associated endoribonuclease Cas6